MATEWLLHWKWAKQKHENPKEEGLKKKPESYANVCKETHSSEKEFEWELMTHYQILNE